MSSKERQAVAPPNATDAPSDAGHLEVVVLRSRRRQKTVSWLRRGNTVELAVPARLSAKEVERWVSFVRERINRRLARAHDGDPALLERARELWRRHFSGPCPLNAARWSDRQRARWGSCLTDGNEILLSSRLKSFPIWVLDYVIVHELAHLIHPDHSQAFWALVGRYPLVERARGFLLACDLGLAAGDPEVAV